MVLKVEYVSTGEVTRVDRERALAVESLVDAFPRSNEERPAAAEETSE